MSTFVIMDGIPYFVDIILIRDTPFSKHNFIMLSAPGSPQLNKKNGLRPLQDLASITD